MHIILWEFRAVPGKEAEFERAYSSGGEWARFFQRDAAYWGTELVKDATDSRRFITIDRWTSRDAYEAFQKREAMGYQQLDARLARLCATETFIGAFTTDT